MNNDTQTSTRLTVSSIEQLEEYVGRALGTSRVISEENR